MGVGGGEVGEVFGLMVVKVVGGKVDEDKKNLRLVMGDEGGWEVGGG